MPRKNDFAWTEGDIETLRDLWADLSLSSAAIGCIMHRGKNSIVGKANRLALPARPSPINFGAVVKERGPVPIRKGPPLPPLASFHTGNASVGAQPHAEITYHAQKKRNGRGAVRRDHGAIFDRASIPAETTEKEVSTRGLTHNERRAEQRAIDAETESHIATFKPRPRPARPCCWPIGDPGTKGFRFCDAAAMPGKPYCTEHDQIAYVKPRDRRPEEYIPSGVPNTNPNFARTLARDE